MRRFFLFLRDAGRFIYALFTLLDTLLSLIIHLSLFVFTLYLFISTWIKEDLTLALILFFFMTLVIHPIVLAIFPLKELPAPRNPTQ